MAEPAEGISEQASDHKSFVKNTLECDMDNSLTMRDQMVDTIKVKHEQVGDMNKMFRHEVDIIKSELQHKVDIIKSKLQQERDMIKSELMGFFSGYKDQVIELHRQTDINKNTLQGILNGDTDIVSGIRHDEDMTKSKRQHGIDTINSEFSHKIDTIKSELSHEIDTIKSQLHGVINSEKHTELQHDTDKIQSERQEVLNRDDEQTSCRSYLKGFASSSTVHGLPRITGKGSIWIKLFWGALLICSFGFSMWQVTGIFREYLKYPVYLDVQVHEGDQTFPQITVCNHNNLYSRSKIIRHPILWNHSFLRSNNDRSLYNDLLGQIAELSEDERIQLSYNASEFVYVNQDSEGRFEDAKPTLIHRLYGGNCYMYPGMEGGNVKTTGMFINFNSNDYLINNSHIVTLRFNQPGLFPFKSNMQYMLINPGRISEVKIRSETINLLNGRYGFCQNNEENFKERTGFAYTQQLCEEERYLKNIIMRCGCIDNSMYQTSFNGTKLVHARNCLNRNESRCANSVGYSSDENSKKICKRKCRTHDFSLTSAKYALSDFEPMARQICSVFNSSCNRTNVMEWVISNTAYVELSFQNNRYKEFSQIPLYPLSRFMSDLGGTMGFYLGASALTLFELTHLLSGLTVCLFRKKSKLTESNRIR